MTKIVLGIGTSHTPLLTLAGDEWHNRAKADLQNPRLSLSDGRYVTYQELVAAVGEPYAAHATPENFRAIADRCQGYLDRLADDIEAANIDVMVIVGDDQSELYKPGNMPAIALYYGDEVVTHSYDDEMPDWFQPVAEGYGMDYTHRFPGHPALANAIIRGLIDRHVDLAICGEVPDPEKAGFGHAFGFPVERLFKGRTIPIVPLMLNTYYPPNVLSSGRCFDIGVALRSAIEDIPGELRVAVLASGGLSHFVVDEELDHRVIDNLGPDGAEALRSIPREALHEGSSEILNWILTAGAVAHLPLRWRAYEAVHRTPAGTGVGCAFATWGGAA